MGLLPGQKLPSQPNSLFQPGQGTRGLTPKDLIPQRLSQACEHQLPQSDSTLRRHHLGLVEQLVRNIDRRLHENELAIFTACGNISVFFRTLGKT
jgi:hypothetical protein